MRGSWSSLVIQAVSYFHLRFVLSEGSLVSSFVIQAVSYFHLSFVLSKEDFFTID